MIWEAMFPMRHVLALDPATRKFGWAIGSADMEAPLTGVFNPPHAGERHGVMLGALRDWLDMQIKVYHCTKVIYEAPFAGANAKGFGIVCKMLGVVELVCDDHEIPCVRATSHEWRKRFLGHAQAPREIGKALTPSAARAARRDWLKTAALDGCKRRGWPVATDDEADAVGLLDFLLSLDSPSYAERTAEAA